MGPGSYSVSVLECADEGERKGRWWWWWVGGGAPDQTAVPLLDWDGWALWQRTRTVTRVYRFCAWLFFCTPATVHLTVKTWRVSLKSLITHFGFRLMCFFFCWQDVSRFCKATMTLQFTPGSHTWMIFIYANHSSQHFISWYIRAKSKLSVLDV